MRPIKVPASVKNYQLDKCIGSGNFGSVYRAIDSRSKEYVALKIIPKDKIREQPKLGELIQTEIKVLRDCKSEHVIKLIEHFENSTEIFIVMEYCNEGDFEKYMEKKKVLSEQEALTFLKQLLSGFKGLHEINVIHRDFKIANLLMHDGKLKIGDLGFAKQTKSLAATCLGTTLYMAPEVLENSKYTNKVDIWSLAIVYYQMLFGHDKYPFYANNDLALLKKIKDGVVNYEVNGIHISDLSKDLLSRMLRARPEERIEWSEIYDHPLIRPPAPAVNQKMGMSMIRSIAGFEMIGNSLSNDKWNENLGFYKEIEVKKQSIDKYNISDKQEQGNPNNNYNNNNNNNNKNNNLFEVKKPDFNFDKPAAGGYFEPIPEEELQNQIQIVKKKEIINDIAKRLRQTYLHFRNINCVYARVLEGLQLNPSQNLNVLFPQYLLMKKIYLENNRLINSIRKRINIFNLTEDIELIEGALKHEFLQRVLGSLESETEVLGINYTVLKEDMAEAIKKMKELDKKLAKYINDEDGKEFNERFREDVYNLALSINDEFNQMKDQTKDQARRKLVLAIEVFNCLCPQVVFPFDTINPQNNFDFKKYEEGLERKSISALAQDLQQAAGLVIEKMFV